MAGLYKISLLDIIEEYGEDAVTKLLSCFSCPLNLDIEDFLQRKAIVFERQSLCRTQLVFASYQSSPVLCGYYTIAQKSFNISNAASLSKSKQKVVSKYATYYPELKMHILPAPLIAQLGKNFSNGYNKLITGDDLMKMACEDVALIHKIAGGKIIYLECEDKERLIEFYKKHGFVQFGKRTLDKDEDKITGKYLIQMLRIM